MFSGDSTMQEKKFIQLIRTSGLLIRENLKLEISESIINKLSTNNVLLFLTLGGTFSLPNLFEASLNYSFRCFTIITGTQNFSELSFAILARILKSSQLRVTSELEVFDAVDFWVGCESRERLKFAKSLLLKVRLPLLSRHALKSVLKRTAHVDCAGAINDVLNETIKPPNR